MADELRAPQNWPDTGDDKIPDNNGRRVCPFLTVLTAGSPGDGDYYKCMQGDCELWDEGTERCGANTVALRSKMVDLETKLTTMQTKLETLNSGSTEFTNVLKHMHDSHMHINASSNHTADNLETEGGNYILGVMPTKIPLANLIVSEFMANEDLDNDDLIYGKDFAIIGTGMPNLIAQIQSDQSFRPDPGHYRWTWEEYMTMKQTGAAPSASGDITFDGGTYS